jgi:CRP/FNR family transcriptional regulator, cyclic AMP receptor protein
MTMTKSAKSYREHLRAGRWFRGIPEALQDAILEMSHLRRAVPYERVVAEGAAPTEVLAVLEGKMRVSRKDPRDGKEMLLTIVEPPNWCCEMGLFDGAPRSHDMTADEESLLLHVPADPLLALLEREPRYWRDFGRLMSAKLRLTFMGMEDAAYSTVSERVAHRLVMMAEGYGEWADRSYPLVKASQETLATMVSSSRQSVNRALKDLEEQGLIKLGYAGVELLDIDKLRGSIPRRDGVEPTPLVTPRVHEA